MKIRELLKETEQLLTQNKIEDSAIKARVLLQYVLKKEKNYFIINSEEEVPYEMEMQYKQFVQELLQGKPLQYITSVAEFMGLNFYVNENVLIPQPDTEILVEETIMEIEQLRKEDPSKVVRILDLCTGSGAIAISLAKYMQKENKEKRIVEIYAGDISQKALEVAKRNAKQHEVKVNWILSNMFENITEQFDIIVSNPPYIEQSIIQTLPKEVQNEPYIALNGGKDGLDFYRIIANTGTRYLRNSNGSILVEIGYNQKESVMELFRKANLYDDISCMKDLAGNDRVVKIRI